jgi:RimJ/RimL family protein N-acetyltransferase
MSLKRPEPTVIEGSFVRLEPMTPAHLPALFRAIGHPEVFAGGYGGGPAGYRDTEESFVEWALSYYRFGVGDPFAVFLVGGENDGLLIGTSTLADYELGNETVHLGWTAYDPRVWGTVVNAEVKYLLLDTVFEHGFGRVKIQADAVNERSRAAIAGIGATFEGVTRRQAQRADGSWRDAAVYSILVDEWPAVRELLAARITRQGSAPVEFRSR